MRSHSRGVAADGRRSGAAEPEIPAGEFYHESLRVDGGKQFNLHYEVAAGGPFDVFPFGGQADPGQSAVYRRAVGRGAEQREQGPGRNRVGSGPATPPGDQGKTPSRGTGARPVVPGGAGA